MTPTRRRRGERRAAEGEEGEEDAQDAAEALNICKAVLSSAWISADAHRRQAGVSFTITCTQVATVHCKSTTPPGATSCTVRAAGAVTHHRGASASRR